MKTDTSCSGWCNEGQWWVDRPVTERASVVAGSTPVPFMVISFQCRALVDVRGSAALGFHGVSVTANGAADQCTLTLASLEGSSEQGVNGESQGNVVVAAWA